MILVLKGDNVRMEHVGTRGLLCSLERLKILLDVCEELLGVCSIPLGFVLAVEVIVVIALLIDVVDSWTKIASNTVK